MRDTAAPPPIPGRRIDPAPKPTDGTLLAIEDRNAAAGVGFRAFTRFTHAKVTLLAAGTTYYLFLSLFAVIAVAFGIAALIGADAIADLLNETLSSAFPGLTGQQGINAEQLRSFGQATSIVGLLILLYSGTGSVAAAVDSLHQIYGTARDGRNFALARVRMLGWLFLLAPLMLLSFAPGFILTTSSERLQGLLGTSLTAAPAVVWVVATVLATALSFAVIYLMLNHLGGIRPARRAVAIGALVGALGVEILKGFSQQIVSWSVAKPQYGAFAVPITVLLMIYLLTLVTYGSATVTAAVAEQSDQGNADGGSEDHGAAAD